MTKEDQKPSLTIYGSGKHHLDDTPYAPSLMPRFSINNEGDKWGLRREGEIAAKRHEKLAKEALVKGLGGVLSGGGMDISNGKQHIRVTFPPQKVEYKFIWRRDGKGQVGTGEGDGKSKVGDKLGKDKGSQGQGQGKGAGEGGEGEVEYAEAPLDEVLNYLFDDLELPISARAGKPKPNDIDFTDVRKKGLEGNLDIRRTAKENIKRNAAKGNPRFGNIKNEDLRYKVWEPRNKGEINAVVIAMMDVSASMGEERLRIAKAAARLQYLFLKTKYPEVDFVCIAHANQTKTFEKDSVDDFWKIAGGLGGGTDAISALKEANNLVKMRFKPEEYDIFGLYLGDGEDNAYKDSETVKEAQEFFSSAVQLGFAEITSLAANDSVLRERFRKAAGKNNADKYVPLRVVDKEHAIDVLRALYPKGGRRKAS